MILLYWTLRVIFLFLKCTSLFLSLKCQIAKGTPHPSPRGESGNKQAPKILVERHFPPKHIPWKQIISRKFRSICWRSQDWLKRATSYSWEEMRDAFTNLTYLIDKYTLRTKLTREKINQNFCWWIFFQINVCLSKIFTRCRSR